MELPTNSAPPEYEESYVFSYPFHPYNTSVLRPFQQKSSFGAIFLKPHSSPTSLSASTTANKKNYPTQNQIHLQHVKFGSPIFSYQNLDPRDLSSKSVPTQCSNCKKTGSKNPRFLNYRNVGNVKSKLYHGSSIILETNTGSQGVNHANVDLL